MSTVVLRTAARSLIPVLAAASVYLVLRGHNAVGGGFIGALVGGAAIVLQFLAFGSDGLARWPLRADLLIGAGLVVAVAVGLGGLLGAGAFLAGALLEAELPLVGEVKVASSLAFDVGVYLVVVGMILAFVGTLGARDEAQR